MIFRLPQLSINLNNIVTIVPPSEYWEMDADRMGSKLAFSSVHLGRLESAFKASTAGGTFQLDSELASYNSEFTCTSSLSTSS